MNTKTMRASYNLPLVVNPITRDYRISGPTTEIVIQITACPNESVQYHFDWQRHPATGKTAACEGQVTLKRNAARKAADTLATVRAHSDGRVYAGVTTGGYWRQSLKKYQLHDVDDFEFSGRILESE